MNNFVAYLSTATSFTVNVALLIIVLIMLKVDMRNNNPDSKFIRIIDKSVKIISKFIIAVAWLDVIGFVLVIFLNVIN